MSKKEKKTRKQLRRKLIATLVLSIQMVGMAQYVPAKISQCHEVKAVTKQVAKVQSVVTQLNQKYKSTEFDLNTYHASVSPVSQFQTDDGKYGVAYSGKKEIIIYIYSKNLEIERTFKIKHEFQLVGGVTCDQQGNLYVIYGEKNPKESQLKEVLIIRKYDRNGIQLKEVTYRANETCPYSGYKWGTKIPFHSGNCSTTIQGNILAINYAREMYSGHQSNHVIYIDINTMEKLEIASSYVSHSFDQRILATSDGEFLTLNHGDARYRGFVVSKYSPHVTDTFDVKNYTMFHFREGANRDYGYNETYAQLGGVVELTDSYAVAAASEKTLSYDTAPTNIEYCGYSEARNLFVQFMKKDFQNYTDASQYQVPGETRTATGKRPKNAKTILHLEDGVKDYGVIWLTNYQAPYYVANPKVVALNQEEIAILYEKRKYGEWDHPIQDSYYMIVNHSGKIVKGPISLGGIKLPANEDVVYINGEIFWTTTTRVASGEEKVVTRLETNRLTLDKMVDVKSLKEVKVKHPRSIYGQDDKVTISVMDGKVSLVEGIDYWIKKEDTDEDYKVVYMLMGMGRYRDNRQVVINIAPGDIKLIKLESKLKREIRLIVSDEYEWDYDYNAQVVYADNKAFKNAKKFDVWLNRDITINQLVSNKTYYVKIRRYYQVDGGKRNYGRFSEEKKIRVK